MHGLCSILTESKTPRRTLISHRNSSASRFNAYLIRDAFYTFEIKRFQFKRDAQQKKTQFCIGSLNAEYLKTLQPIPSKQDCFNTDTRFFTPALTT